MAHIMNFDEGMLTSRQGWPKLFNALREHGHEVGEPVASGRDHYLVEVPLDGKLCTLPELLEALRQDTETDDE